MVFSVTAVAEDVAKWGPRIDLEAKPGSKRTLGEVDLLLPIAQDENTLAFTNLRGRFDDNSSREGNLGLGVRHMLKSGWNLGAYGYFDRRRSEYGHYFNQATLGVEALGRDWDFRANGYLPVGTRAKSLGTTGGGASTATLSGTSILVTTPGSTTREERALKGFDAEVGWRTPLFESEAARQLRLYLGGYRFNGAGISVHGPRVRAELEVQQLPVFSEGSALFLNAEAQDDNARGGQTFLGIRVQIPLGATSKRANTLTAQERRMNAPIMRDVDIVTQSRVAASTPTLVETVDASTPSAAVTVNGQAATVVSSATTTGAALQAALTSAGNNSTVVLTGTFNTAADTTLQTGQTAMGVGNLTVNTPSGHTATLAAPGATINRNGAPAFSNVVNMGDNSSLVGMTVAGVSAGGGGYAVNAQNKTGVTLNNNTLSSSFTSGYTVDFSGSANAVVTGNTISATSSAGGATGIRTSSAANIKISGNTITATGVTSYVVSGNNFTSFAAGSTGNVAGNGICIFGGAPTGSVGFSTISCP